MSNIYKTSQGQTIDLDKLILKNEEVRAVGNMGVNARGDIVNDRNEVTMSKSKQVERSYRKQIGNHVKDLPVMSSKKAVELVAQKYIKAQANLPPIDTIDGLDSPNLVQETAEVVTEPAPVKTSEVLKEEINQVSEQVATEAIGGLASAIAKAKEAKQETPKTSREE